MKDIPKTPWQYTEFEKAGMFSIHTEGTNAEDPAGDNIACGVWYGAQERERSKKIAELIVTAVNERDELKKTIESQNVAILGHLADKTELVERLNGMINYWDWSIGDPDFEDYRRAKSTLQKHKEENTDI